MAHFATQKKTQSNCKHSQIVLKMLYYGNITSLIKMVYVNIALLYHCIPLLFLRYHFGACGAINVPSKTYDGIQCI